MRFSALKFRAPRILIAFVMVACGDPTAPGSGLPPGLLLLNSTDFSDWSWTPAGDELLYSHWDHDHRDVPTTIEAVHVVTGAKRTVVSPFGNGDWIVPARFVGRGTHVYFEVFTEATDTIALWRAPLHGAGTPERIVAFAAPAPQWSVSPDERAIAWITRDLPTRVVVRERATGSTRSYPLPQWADHVWWSPDGTTVVADVGSLYFGPSSTFQWLDLATGVVRSWTPPANLNNPGIPTVGWKNGSPYVYVVSLSVTGYAIAAGAVEHLASLSQPGVALGWSADFESVIVASNLCRDVSSGPFGGDCLLWSSSVDRITWRTGARRNVFRFEGSGDIRGVANPDASWVAFHYRRSSGYSSGDGIYVDRVP